MKIFSLIQNELIKQFKKPSIKIIYVLVLLSAIILPMGISKIPVNPYEASNMENNKFRLTQIENEIKNYENDDSEEKQIQLEYATIEKDCVKMMVDYNIGYDDWKQEQIRFFEVSAYELAAIQFVLDGFEKDTVLKMALNINPDKINEYYDMTLEEKKEIELSLIEEKDKNKKIVEENDYTAYSEKRIKENEKTIEEFKVTIKDYEELKEKNSTDEEDIEKLKQLKEKSDNAKIKIEHLKEDNEIILFRINNDINYDSQNWKNNALESIEE